MSAHLKQHKSYLAKTSLGQPSPYFSEGVYVDPEIVADLQVFRANKTTIFYFESKASSATDFVSWVESRSVAFSLPLQQPIAKENIRALADRLCEEHPAISTYEGIFGGTPHIKGLRLSVADVLEQLYLTGSIDAVLEIYSPDLSEDQIKEAIAYAQDFLESAVSSSS